MDTPDHRCPACDSPDVCLGAFPLKCFACGWSYLNKHPCETCGAPAVAVIGGAGGRRYRCAAHPFGSDDVRASFAGFVASVTGGRP
jgi:hypothetical protein